MLLQGAFYSPLGKKEHDSMSGKEILPTDKESVNICLLLLIVKTHLMVLLYFVFLEELKLFLKNGFLEIRPAAVFLKQD